MTKSPEQLDEFIRLVQNQGDASGWNRKTPQDAGLVNIVSLLNNVPKAAVPHANLMRARAKVMDRISIPVEETSEGTLAVGLLRVLPRFARIAGGIVGAFTIMLSLTIGTAVAALESVPGQTIYPVKRMVESVQLKLASDQEQKTNLKIKFANNRVDELEAILQKQKEGEASDEDVQKVVADTIKGIQETAEAVTANTDGEDPQVAQLAKIVTLTDKQTAVITAAQAGLDDESSTDTDLALALEASQTARELAIDNIEKAGLMVESQPMIIADGTENKNAVTAEGQLTAVLKYSISIGSARFLLTEQTEYVNITPEGLAVGAIVKITGETKNDTAYANKIELLSPAETEAPAETEGQVEGEESPQQVPEPETEPETIPADPQ